MAKRTTISVDKETLEDLKNKKREMYGELHREVSHKKALKDLMNDE